jgi:hypothetical protein
MLDIFQTGPWRTRPSKFAPILAKRRLAPAGDLGAAEAVRGFVLKFCIEGDGISSATAPGRHNRSVWNNPKKRQNMIGEKHGRKN